MKQILLFSIALFSGCLSTEAQDIFKDKQKIEPYRNFGRAKYEVAYLHHAEDPYVESGKVLERDYEMILLIGDNYSQYKPIGRLRYDSVMNTYCGKYLSGMEQLGIAHSTNMSGKDYYLVRDHRNNDSITIREVIMSIPNLGAEGNYFSYKSIYTEEAPQIQWEITDEKKQISGRTVTKATGRHHGRDWTVWFDEEIPISEGPWELTGLPGLILEASDAKGEHKFFLMHMKPSNREMLQANEKGFTITTREKVNKFRRESADAENANYKSGKRPFSSFSNFIELE